MEYHCAKCGMGVKGMACSKCGSELVHKSIKSTDGKEIHVSECPNHHGKIKSPMCCGQDMESK